MSKDEQEKTNENKKQNGFFVREIKSYRRYFMFKSSTPEILGKKIGFKNLKEISKTFKSLEKSEISFQRSLENEGIVEDDLPVAHKRYNIILIVLFLMMIYPFFNLVLTLLNKYNDVEFTYGFIPSLLPPLVSFFFILFFYLNYNWMQWRIRNKNLITPLNYLKVLAKFPSQLIPIHEYKDTMEETYGEDWKKQL